MIGLDFPVKPEWIHDVHALWQPEQSVSELVEAALDHTMQELGGEKTRRNSLSIILRYFVAITGGGQSRRTAAQDVWVAYSRVYPHTTMAPAYLAHLVGQNEVARSVSQFIMHRYKPGDTFASNELRGYAAARFGQRKVVVNAASAFLSTLVYFGALAPTGRRGEYRFDTRSGIDRQVFPLVVWSWWQRHLSPQIELDVFENELENRFLNHPDLGDLWRSNPSLWTLEERLGSRRATLRHSHDRTFQEALLRLLPTP